MRSVLGWSVLSIAMLFATMSASDRANAAVLNLVIDSTTKTLWFDGSDSGTFAVIDTGAFGIRAGRVTWGTRFGEDSFLSTNSTIIATITPAFQLEHRIGFRQSDLGLYIEGNTLYSSNPGTASWTFTGKGSSAAISYAGLSSAFQSRLESLATSNTQLSVTRGTAGNSLKMSLFSSGGSGGSGSGGNGGGGEVPEPTSMAIFGLGALGMAYRARRKAKA